MKRHVPAAEYVEQARKLSKEDAERLLARMRKKLTRGLAHEKLEPLDAVALQLQYEDEQLREWRENLAKLRKKHSA